LAFNGTPDVNMSLLPNAIFPILKATLLH